MNENYEKLLKQVKSSDFDLVLIVANSIDSAKVIQYLRVNDINKPTMCSGWAKTMDLLTNGGKAVEGVFFSTAYDDNSKDEAYVKFYNEYKQRYGREPSVFAAQGYETGKVLIENLKKSTDIAQLKQNILAKKIIVDYKVILYLINMVIYLENILLWKLEMDNMLK